jgi:predicted Zn-dependent peptidase
MEKQIFSEINAYISGEVEEGTLQISGKPVSGISLEEADLAVEEEINTLRTQLVGERELEKIKNKFESNDLFSNINYMNKATNMAIFELIGDANMIDHEVEKYRKVDAAQILETAQKVLRPDNCSTLYYKQK